MNKPSEIIDALGVDTIARHLGVSASRVRRVRFEPFLPAAWYAAMSDLAGYDLPREAFTFLRANKSKRQ